MKKKKISFFTPCFNEEDNIIEMYNSVMKSFLIQNTIMNIYG